MLGVKPIIEHYQKQIHSGSTIQDIKNELEKGGRAEQRLLLKIQEQESIKIKQLRREQLEKKKIEEDLKRLEQRRQQKDQTLNPTIMSQVNPSISTVQTTQSKTQDP